MTRLKMARPSNRILASVLSCFLVADILHFFFLMLIERSFAINGSSYHLDSYSILLGFVIGLEINAFLAGIIIFFALILLPCKATQWHHLARLLCLLVPLGPLMDLVLHNFGIKSYRAYQNLFSVEISPWGRLSASILPGFADHVIHFTYGHRLLFLSISVLSAAFIFRYTRDAFKALLMLSLTYVSICSALGFLSPSDIPPSVIAMNSAFLPVLIWVGNALLIARSEFIARSVSLQFQQT